ncbi:MAG TPA: ABC transporter substrate-binding protein [Burkholderiaceae bacterium]|nr:ABC transporter substrate-binding protein [Burkholderiaceae bacterium]
MRLTPGSILATAALGLAAALAAAPVRAVDVQFIPVFTGRDIPGPAGSLAPAGMIDYLQLLNRRDGGIGGVTLAWDECETAFDDARGVACFERLRGRGARGAAVLLPLSSGISYALTERAREARIPMLMLGYGRADAADGRAFPYAFPIGAHLLSQAAAQVRFIGEREGGMAQLRGKTIVNLHLELPTGREAIGLLDELAALHGFALVHIGVPLPGVDQAAAWARIRSLAADWVLLAGPGPMTPAALRAAAAAGFPAERMIGFGLSGAEQDVRPAGAAAVGYIALALNPSGRNFVVLREIVRHVHGGQAPEHVGSAHYNRGVIQGLLVAEAIRIAQRRFGARALSGAQLRWGLERLALDEDRLARVGALGLLQPLALSCFDHEGGGAVTFQQWLGERWNVVSDWVSGDQALVRRWVERAAAAYARTRGIPLRDCAREDDGVP